MAVQAAASVLEYETVVREWTAAIKQGLARFHTEIKSEMAAARTFGQLDRSKIRTSLSLQLHP